MARPSDNFQPPGDRLEKKNLKIFHRKIWRLRKSPYLCSRNRETIASLDAAVLRGTQEDKELIYVYVYGEVNNPGVVGCKKDSRVYEVVELCGGYTEDANESCINPVRKVSDGEKIYIPYVGEDYSQGIYDDDSYKVSQEYAASSYGDYGASQQNTRININTAAKEQLVTLPGIGTSRAEDIISYRSKNGSFKSIEDIKKVPGIKDGAFAKIKDYICV